MPRHSLELETAQVINGIQRLIYGIDASANQMGHPIVQIPTVGPVRFFATESCVSPYIPGVTAIQFFPGWFNTLPPRSVVWRFSPVRATKFHWEYEARSLEMIGDHDYRMRAHAGLLTEAGTLPFCIPLSGEDVASTPGSLAFLAMHLMEIDASSFGTESRLLPRPSVSDRMHALLNRVYSLVPGFTLRKS